jgi:hypothetical protein
VAAGVRLAEIVTVAMLMLVSNRKAWYCFFMLDDRKYSCEYGSAASDYVTWSLVAAGVLLLLARRAGRGS